MRAFVPIASFGYAHDAVDAVEEANCSRGCRRGARTKAERDDVGPGGSCDVLCRIAFGDDGPIPELRWHDGDIVCLAWEPRPARPPRPRRGPRPIAGQLTIGGEN